MKGTSTEKILLEHLVEGELKTGNEIAIRPDDTLTQDATGTLAWLQFEITSVQKVKTRTVSAIDHNTVQMGYENADDHDYLQSVAAKYGAWLSKAGNGICHQVYLESFAFPGGIVLGSDSHTPTAGGMGQIGIGVGGLDVALAMAGQPYRLKTPKVIGIHLTGKLNDWVTAKDVILYVIKHLGTNNKFKVFEYLGPGVQTLSVPERATITNMGAEAGVTFSIFPGDLRTFEYLLTLGRKDDYREIMPDPGAKYSSVFEINLSKIEPMIVLPKKEKGLGPVTELSNVIGKKVNQVCIGACTNSSYHDVTVSGYVLKDRKVDDNIELLVTPGTRRLKQAIIDNSAYSYLISAGARITEETCNSCIGQGYSPRSEGVRVSTHNRNFKGRCGTDDAEVYLVSPETAAATALKGVISDPREVFKDLKYGRFLPSLYPGDSPLLIKYPGDSSIEIIRGPNIKEVPKGHPLPDSIDCVVTLKFGDNITTDDIIPGKKEHLKLRSNVPKYSELAYLEVDSTFINRAKQYQNEGVSNIIVGGDGTGQGSSREHAAICQMYLGVSAVIAKSFHRIHEENLINFGIIPLIFKNSEDYNKIEQGDNLQLVNTHQGLKSNNLILKDLTKNYEIPLVHGLNTRQIGIVLAGGALQYRK